MLRRWRAAWPKHSKRFDPPWPQAAPAPPPPALYDQGGPRPRYAPRPRRGRFHEPPWTQGNTGGTQTARARARPLPAARRGRYLPVPPPSAAWIPQYPCVRRAPARPPRRGTYQPVPAPTPQSWPPPYLTPRRRTPPPTPRAGRRYAPVAAAVPLGPGMRVVSARPVTRWSAREGGARWSARETQ